MKDRRRTDQEEEGKGLPPWIVSFTDMVTLLLSFFIMLQTLASIRDKEIFYLGRDSFRRAIAGVGMPDWLFGKFPRPKFDYVKRKHTAPKARHNIPMNRLIDYEGVKIRHAFAELREQIRTRASDVTAGLVDKRITPVTFASGKSDLGKSAKDYLSDMAISLKQTLSPRSVVMVYVIGLGSDGATEKSQWSLSARRAKTVQDFLQSCCPDEAAAGRLRFSSWGIGPGDKWRKKIGRIPDTSHIVVIITEEGR